MPKATILGELGLPRVFFNTIPVSGLDFEVARNRILNQVRTKFKNGNTTLLPFGGSFLAQPPLNPGVSEEVNVESLL